MTPAPIQWQPFLSLLLQVTLFGLGCVLLDASSLGPEAGSWGGGYVLVFVVVTAVYASWPLLGTAILGLVATVAGSPATARRVTLVGVVVAAALGLGGLALAAVTLLTASEPADVAFVAVLAVASLPPFLPLIATVRRGPEPSAP